MTHDEIIAAARDRLAAMLAECHAAMKPFADKAKSWKDMEDYFQMTCTLGQCRLAADILRRQGAKP